MNQRMETFDATITAGPSPRPELADILERYLADLEQGRAPDEARLLGLHPELAQELKPYLASLRLLHRAADGLRGARGATNGSRDHGRGSIADDADDAGLPMHSGGARQIGDYRILREIGRGGMGIVYEAHQVSLNRRVALKILPFAAVLDQRQIARFRNEAQAAAQLHHSHIVPVFAVGQEKGVYYYAMQYIDGQSLEQAITDLRQGAQQRAQQSTKAAGGARGSTTTMGAMPASAAFSRLSTRHGDFFHSVAQLGKEAAQALQHAHEYGIVHRDIKPSNLLLDSQGKLWVTDFGLARMQSDNGMTLTGDVVGTLRYMSPEQASGQPALVDARTDVYSLGVTLYELLTQRPPFAGEDRQSLLRQIVGEDPVPPRRHNPAVPTDLETIVLGAMAKSRDERYASAQALADDLDRFLAGKPTLARRPTLADRAAKWARRHRALVAMAAGALVVLSAVSLLGVGLLARERARTFAALAQAQENARQAQQNVERAERHFRQARNAVDQLGVRIADRLAQVPGAEGVRRDLLVDALGYYRQFAADAGDEPQLRHELALAHFKSGSIARQLGAMNHAIEEYEAAIELLSDLTAAKPEEAELLAQLAVAHNNLALLLAAREETVAAREHYTEAIALGERLIKDHADQPEFVRHLAESRANLGMLLNQLGDASAAEASLRAALEVLRGLAAKQPVERKSIRDLAIACNNLSYVVRRHDREAAKAFVQEAIVRLEELAPEASEIAGHQEDLALCYNNLAALHVQWEDMADAVECYNKAIALQERLARKAPAVVRHRSELATTLSNLGVAYCRAERAAEADAVFGRARELLATLAEDYPDELAYRSALAALLNNQAFALAGANRHEDALPTYSAALKAQRPCYERWSDAPLMRDVLSRMYYNYAQSLRATERYGDALMAAAARRDLWQGDGERLVGVAAEFAELRGELKRSSAADDLQTLVQTCDEEIVASLWQAYDSGWPAGIDLAADERFAYLHGDERFASLAAKTRANQ